MNNKGFIPILAVIIAVVIIAGGIGSYLYIKNKNISSIINSSNNSTSTGQGISTSTIACTQEAKQCPDGSYVGRIGPKCEFASCPTISISTVVATTSTNVTADYLRNLINNGLDTSSGAGFIIDNDEDSSDDMIDAAPGSARVASVETATKNGIIDLNIEDGFFSKLAVHYDDSPAMPQVNKPLGYNFKYGLIQFEFNIIVPPGSTVFVGITFPESIPRDAKYFRVTSYGWVESPFIRDTKNNKKIYITLTDGGEGDTDGAKNASIISEPNGLGILR